MSLLKTIRAQLGISATATQNFTLDASASDGTMKLARGNAGATTQDILTVDASGNVNAPVGIKKAGSVLQALSDFTGTNVSLASSGYQKLPSGLIVQWGRATSSGSLTVTFPLAFTSVLGIHSTPRAESTHWITDLTNTTFNLRTGGATAILDWIAYGY